MPLILGGLTGNPSSLVADMDFRGVRVDLDRGSWIDPDAGSISLADFATTWLAERPGLRPRTPELYESELRLHILPVLGDVPLRQLSAVAGRGRLAYPWRPAER